MAVEGGQFVAIFNQAGELADAVFLVGLYVDDRSEFGLVEVVGNVFFGGQVKRSALSFYRRGHFYIYRHRIELGY